MRSLSRLAAGAVAALALAVPVQAQSPSPEPSASPAPSAMPYVQPKPTAVVVHIEGGFHPANRWLWYERDGTARFKGILEAEQGVFRSRVDYRKVEQILTDNEMCARHATIVRPAAVGIDVFFYRVSVRCGTEWRYFSSGDPFATKSVELSRNVVRELERLASNLTWERTTETLAPPA